MARRKTTPWREDTAILERMARVRQRHLAGEPNTRIAAVLGVAEGTVRQDIKREAELWREYTAFDGETARARVVQQLMDVYRRALASAEFDEQAERAVLYGYTPQGPDGESLIVQRDEKGSAQFRGNKAAALAQARQALVDIAKVLGLVVDKQALTDPNGKALDLASLILLARKDT